MKAQRHRRGAVILSISLFGMLAGHRDVAARQPSPAVQTPPEVTIQPLPPGPVFADVDGYTLYVSERDAEPGKSACVGACTAEWTPLRAPADAQVIGEWTLVARADGAAQWAYKGRPLYRYAKETRPRWADGQSQSWRYALVSPFPARGAFGRQQGLGGAPPAAAAAAAAGAGLAQGGAGFANVRGVRPPKVPLPPGVPGGITGQPNTEGAVFADAKGLTLYTSTAAATCAGPCLEVWRPLPAPLLATAPAGDWSIATRPDGTLQWSHKGKPLYRSRKDMKAGDTNGADSDWQALRVPGH
ncbi:MAG: hypothetical protein ABL971_06735 [Vicinamibacterales bacterium]